MPSPRRPSLASAQDFRIMRPAIDREAHEPDRAKAARVGQI
jgi:hypothetical protein